MFLTLLEHLLRVVSGVMSSFQPIDSNVIIVSDMYIRILIVLNILTCYPYHIPILSFVMLMFFELLSSFTCYKFYWFSGLMTLFNM